MFFTLPHHLHNHMNYRMEEEYPNLYTREIKRVSYNLMNYSQLSSYLSLLRSSILFAPHLVLVEFFMSTCKCRLVLPQWIQTLAKQSHCIFQCQENVNTLSHLSIWIHQFRIKQHTWNKTSEIVN